MSSNQKALKVMSFIAVLAAIGMAAWTGMALMFANTSTGLLLVICSLATALLDLVLGAAGIGVANRPARGLEVYYIGVSWLAVVLNAVSVVVYVLVPGFVWPAAVNLAIVAVYFRFSRRVRFEALP